MAKHVTARAPIGELFRRLAAVGLVAVILAFVGGFILAEVGAASGWFYAFGIVVVGGAVLQTLLSGAAFTWPTARGAQQRSGGAAPI
jgi:hypothetical protein